MKEIFEIQTLLEKVEQKKLELASLKSAQSCLNFSGHQTTVSVSVGNLKIDLSYSDAQTGYAQRMKPGHDMLILAVKKMYNAKIWQKESEISDLSQKAKALVTKIKIAE